MSPGPRMDGKPVPPNLGVGALFPTAHDKTPHVMTQSVVKEVNGGRAAMHHGQGNGFPQPNLGGIVPNLPTPLVLRSSPPPIIPTPQAPPFRPPASKSPTPDLPNSPPMPPPAPPDPVTPINAAAPPRQPSHPAPALSHPPLPTPAERVPSIPSPPPQPQGGGGTAAPAHRTKIPGGASLAGRDSPGVQDDSAQRHTYAELGSAAMIDDSPLQNQFEQFMKSIEGGIDPNVVVGAVRKKGTPKGTPKRKPPAGLREQAPPAYTPEAAPQRQQEAVGGPSFGGASGGSTKSPLHQSPPGMKKPLGGGAGDPRRKQIMDMHKQMFVGDRSMAEPLELPGDKGVSYYQGASSLGGVMTSAAMDSSNPTKWRIQDPAPRRALQDEDEMWG